MSKKQTQPKRRIRFDDSDIELVVSKVTAIKFDTDFLFHVDRLPDGTARITHNAILLPDLSKIQGITIIRED